MTEFNNDDLKALTDIEKTNNDNYYRDPTHINSKVQDAIENGKKDNISETLAKWVRQKKYGIDVRESLARFILWISVLVNKLSTSFNELSSEQDELKEQQIKLQSQYNAQIGSLTKDSEVIEARIGINGLKNSTLKERLDNELGELLTKSNLDKFQELQDYVNDENTIYGGAIPSYFKDSFQNVLETPTKDRVVIGFLTDSHYQSDDYAKNELKHTSWMAYLTKKIKMDALIFGGDNINGYYDKKQIKDEAIKAVNSVEGQKDPDTPLFWLMGNHDNGRGQNGKNTPEECLTNDEIKEIFGGKGQYGEVRNGNSLYFYKDIVEYKVRVIGLNNFDLPETTNSDGTYAFNTLSIGGYQQEQLEWLANEALKLPDETWQVIIFQHAPIPGTFQTAVDGNDGTPIYNVNAFLGIVKAFQEGTQYTAANPTSLVPVSLSVDFTNQGEGTLIAIVSGHVHRDGQMYYDGMNLIETDCSLSYTGDVSRGRERGTETETAFDVYSIDATERVIEIRRFGAGTNRWFNY